jgi:anti-sigma regulatory factor (Ser/Thr protein kinase)
MATLSLYADLAELAIIREFVEQESRGLGLSERVISDLRLAVDEACTNVIRHAYDGQGGRIEVTIQPVASGIQVQVRDWAKGFDLSAVPAPDVTAPLEERPLGGLGLFLMRKMMDDVQFKFDATHGNTLTMIKLLDRMS